MNRPGSLEKISEKIDIWDILIIGGGATGLGAAVDAASRGFQTLLFEQSDFAKGTSSRSTKLIHGGLRYLQQGNIGLVTEALHERGLLCQNAPHLVHHLPFLVPSYHWWEGPFYGAGVKIYDLLAGKLGLKPSHLLSREETIRAIPTLQTEGLRGGVLYYDGQFDDARLAITLAQTAVDHGAILMNYCKVIQLLFHHGRCSGVLVKDQETGKTKRFYARSVINATGIFSDTIRKMDNKRSAPLIQASQGIHLVLDRSFLRSTHALLVPHTEDKRVLFFVPWHDRVLVGTTDTPMTKPQLEPRPLKEEVSFLLKYAARYLKRPPQKEDVLAVFAGMRPLIKTHKTAKTASLSRDHSIVVSPKGLITIAGGKWTTYRKMAQDVVDKAMVVGKLPNRPCMTEHLCLHGWNPKLDPQHPWSVYGSETKALKKCLKTGKNLNKKIHPRLPYKQVEVIWAARHEMARSVEDVLARRTRALLLDARASIEAAPLVARLLARELKRSKHWEKKQILEYTRLATQYFI